MDGCQYPNCELGRAFEQALAARDQLWESRFQLLAAEIGKQLATEVGSLFRNGPVTRIEERLTAVERTVAERVPPIEEVRRDLVALRTEVAAHVADGDRGPLARGWRWWSIGLVLLGLLLGLLAVALKLPVGAIISRVL